MLVIEKPIFQENGTLTAVIREGGKSRICYYSTASEYKDFIDPERSDCFLIGLLYTAMFAGEDMFVHGCVSQKLLMFLNSYAIPLLHGLDERLHIIRVDAELLANDRYPGAEIVGTGLSGGVDSFSTIYDRALKPGIPAAFKVNALFFFNVGSHGMGTSEEDRREISQKFSARFAQMRKLADEWRLPLIPVDSNVYAFHQSGHLQTSTLATLSAVYFLQRRISRYYVASDGHNYHELCYSLDKLLRNKCIGNIEHMLLPLLGSESLEFISDGNDMSRVEKTLNLIDCEPSRRYLNVCASHDAVTENCSVCYKCCRTLVILDILGKIELFKNVFDISKYRRVAEKRFIAEVLLHADRDMFFRNIVDLAAERHFSLRDRTTPGTIWYMRFTGNSVYRFLKKMPLLTGLVRIFRNPSRLD